MYCTSNRVLSLEGQSRATRSLGEPVIPVSPGGAAGARRCSDAHAHGSQASDPQTHLPRITFQSCGISSRYSGYPFVQATRARIPLVGSASRTCEMSPVLPDTRNGLEYSPAAPTQHGGTAAMRGAAMARRTVAVTRSRTRFPAPSHVEKPDAGA